MLWHVDQEIVKCIFCSREKSLKIASVVWVGTDPISQVYWIICFLAILTGFFWTFLQHKCHCCMPDVKWSSVIPADRQMFFVVSETVRVITWWKSSNLLRFNIAHIYFVVFQTYQLKTACIRLWLICSLSVPACTKRWIVSSIELYSSVDLNSELVSRCVCSD